MKNSLTFVLLTFLSFNAFSQAYSPAVRSVNQDLRELFSTLDIPSHPHPVAEIFYDLAAHQSKESSWQANSPDTNHIDHWSMMYQELWSCQYDTNHLDKIHDWYASSQRFRSDTFAIGMIGHYFHKLKDTALKGPGYFVFDTTVTPPKLYDNYKVEITDTATGDWIINPNSNNPKVYQNPDSASPYITDIVFSIASFKRTFYFDSVVFRIDPDFLFFDTRISNMLSTDSFQLQLDFDDGNGWVNANHNSVSHFNIKFPNNSGFHLIKARIVNPITTSQVASSKAAIYTQPNGGASRSSAKSMPMNPTDSIIEFGKITAGVFPACESTTAEKILLFVEGFDPLEYIPSMAANPNKLYSVHIEKTGLSNLRQYGYTIITISFDRTTSDMRDNADDLVDFIDDLKGRLLPNDGPVRPFVVMGKSQGGIIARYALLKMENGSPGSNRPQLMHNTRLLVTIDSPHQGAVVPVGAQHLYGNILDLATFHTRNP